MTFSTYAETLHHENGRGKENGGRVPERAVVAGSPPEQSHIRPAREGAIGFLTLHCPERLSALDVTTAQDLYHAARQYAQDDTVRVIVLRSTGKVFCSGADLKYIRARGEGVGNSAASAEQLARIVSTMRQAVAAPLVIKLPAKVALPLATVTSVLLDTGILAMVCHSTSANGEPSQAQTVLHASHGKLEVIGVGGVSTGAEALRVLHSGVKAIQIASAVVREGVSTFTRLKRELADSLELRVSIRAS